MNWILKSTIARTGRREMHRLDTAAIDPRRAQLCLMNSIIQSNSRTKFGVAHEFKKITDHNSLQRRIPLRNYDQLQPYIDAILAGDSRALTRCPPFMFNMTSGTTGAPKYIPWNKCGDRAGSALMRQWIYRALRDHPAMLAHKLFCMVSPAVEGYAANGLPVGSASGRIYERIPALVRRHYALPYSVSGITEYDHRYLVALRLSMVNRVSIICTPNPSTLIRLAEIGNHAQDLIIRAVYDGNLGIILAGQPEVQQRLEARLKPDPANARRLERLATAHDTLLPRDYWPDLKLIGCWTGGSAGVQRRILPQFFGDVPVRDLGYLASEGRMSIPVEDRSAAGMLAINTNFFEFIPEDEIDTATRTLLCDELETGQRYYVILTTPSGLYRYDINDIVEVDGWHQKCPLVRFVRKGRDMLNITGEKLHLQQCLTAMRQAGRQLGVAIEQFRFIADPHVSCYHVLVELRGVQASSVQVSQLGAIIDTALSETNSEYRQKRRSLRLGAPRISIMPTGWSAAERRAAVADGKRDVEFKWCHLLDVDQCTDGAEFKMHDMAKAAG